MWKSDNTNFHEQTWQLDPKRSRHRMVSEQLLARGISHPGVLSAMSSLPRHLFVPEALRGHAYEDNALPIGFGQTISQPYIVALMTELLQPAKDMKVLEIGTGSGYQAAILASMGCKVFSLERVREIYDKTTPLLHGFGFAFLRLFLGDGTLGLPAYAPFDRIIVTAGGPQVPRPLLEQLADGGIMLVPVGSRPREQNLIHVSKRNGRLKTRNLGEVAFVDLVGNHGWRQLP